MSNRPLKNKNIKIYANALKVLDTQGFVEYGNIDKFRKEIEDETGYPIDRTYFFRMIKEEMAYRYTDMYELVDDMWAARCGGHDMDSSIEYKEGWYDAIETIKLFMKGGSL